MPIKDMVRFWVILFCMCLMACSSSQADVEPTPHIVIDQFGYLPELDKRAIIRNPEIGYDAEPVSYTHLTLPTKA